MSDTVLVTGISGYIAKHVALRLLEAGLRVRGTVRSMERADEVRSAITANGGDPEGLSFVVADLDSDHGWADAAGGCRFVQHIASPFPLEQPKEREALVPAARQGTLRVLRAGLDAGAERIVLTSSMVAMMYRADRPAEFRVTENDWTDPEWPMASAYIVSKTRAEKAAWDLVNERGVRERLVVVNPGFVLGPLLDSRTGTSIDVIKLILEGAYPAVPPTAFPVVDIRDLAEIEVSAMTADVGGRRLIAARETLSMPEMARILRDAFPERRRIPTRTLPAVIVRMLSLFDRSLKTVLPDLGARPIADSGYVSDLTGVEFRPAAESVLAAAQSVIDRGLV